MHRYRAFGLSIASDIKMDELIKDPLHGSAPDLVIERAKLGYEIGRLGEVPSSMHWNDPDGVTMVWPGAAAVRIAGPDRIEIEPHEEVQENYLAFPLLGPVMGWLLHIRKTYVLHASAVKVDDHSLTFLGDKLAGKSTTAAAFLSAGAALLTDDLLAFDLDHDGAPLIQPAFPQLKLDEASSGSVSVPDATPLPLLMEGFEKKQIRLAAMNEASEPCDAIFVLRRRGNQPRIEWLDGGSALQAILRYSYMIRFGDAPIEMQERKRHFQQAAHIATTTRVGELNLPADLERLPEAVDYVRKELRALQN